MNYSNTELIKTIEKAKKNQKNLTHITDKSKLSTEDKMKLSLCRHFIQFANNKRLTLKKISDMTKIPLPRLSEITNYKITKYTVDQLIKNLTILAEHDRQIHEYLVFLESATELPTLKVAETRKLTRDVREAYRMSLQSAYP